MLRYRTQSQRVFSELKIIGNITSILKEFSKMNSNPFIGNI